MANDAEKPADGAEETGSARPRSETRSAGDAPEPGFVVRPHPLFILFYPVRQYAAIIVLTLIAWLAVIVFAWAGVVLAVIDGAAVLLAGGALLLVRFLWAVLQWTCRAYGVAGGIENAGVSGEQASGAVGDPIVWSEIGVLNRTKNEVGLGRVRSVIVDRPFFQRLFGLGSVGFATAGTGGYEVVWLIVSDPKGLAARVRGVPAEMAGKEDQVGEGNA